jgi:hypothetical protein
MNLTRRQALLRTLFGAGGLGLRSLATGLPIAYFLNPKRAVAAGCTPAKAQYVIMSTSAGGDPINSHTPGTYADPKIIHSPDPALAATALTLAGKASTAGKPWCAPAQGGLMPQNVLDRTVFWHLMTNTPIHPKEPDVLRLMGASTGREMLPSLIAKATAPCLGTVQTQPVVVGAAGPSEAIGFNGSTLPIIPPVALKDTLTNAAGPLSNSNLMALRYSTMNTIYDIYKTSATPAEKAYIDNLVASQAQVRSLNMSLLGVLSNIVDNGINSQILAAITLIQMNIAPVVTIHIPFGGDNHSDTNLQTETSETLSGVAAIASIQSQLQTANLQDKVTFMTLNVFGRTLMTNGGASAANGRNHNGNLQTSVTIGAPFQGKGGVVGAVAPVGNDYGATPIDSMTGAGTASGDIAAVDTLASYAQTMLQAVGGDPSVVTSGKVITSNLA